MSFTQPALTPSSAQLTQLFACLAGLCREHDCAWDCATGSGQAAAGLAALFSQVIATDASGQQIAHASRPGNVDFRVVTAEASGLANHNVDLVTVAEGGALVQAAALVCGSQARVRARRCDRIVGSWPPGLVGRYG